MAYSRDIERSEDAYIKVSSFVHDVGDFTWEWWLKPESLPGVGESYYLVRDELLTGIDAFHVRLFNDAGTLKLRVYGQNDNIVSPPAADFFDVEFDISALVSAGTWEYLALTFDEGVGVATCLELFHGDEATVPTSQGNGTALGGGTGSLIYMFTGSVTQLMGTDNGSQSYDGLVFRQLLWTDIRSLAEIQSNYKLLFANPTAQAGLNAAMWIGGRHDQPTPGYHGVSYGPGIKAFVADVPSGVDMEALGTPGGPALAGAVVVGGPSGKITNGGYRAGWVAAESSAVIVDGPGRRISNGGYRGQWVSAESAEVFLMGSTAATAGAGTTFPPLQSDQKTQFISAEPLEIALLPFVSRLTGQYILGTDVASVQVVRPDDVVYATPPTLTWDSGAERWTGEIDPVNFLEGEWLFYFTSNDPNALPQWLMLWWGDYVDEISEIRQAALGRWRIIGSQLILYEEDELTVFKAFNLKDDLGDPTSTNIFDKDPVP